MDQGIRFVITGDTTGLENASKKAESALEGISRKIAQLEKDISDNIRISQGYETAVAELSNQLKTGTISQDKYARSLTRLKRDEAETTIETNRLRKELSNLKRDQRGLAASTGSVGKGFNKMGGAVTGTTSTMTSFSQVIQDAPYGIRGVANNIQQLTSQFGYLSQRAGGSKEAFKALLGSLTGPAGILLAVSVVTSLLVTYGDKIGDLIKGNNALAASQKAVNKALSEFYGEQVTTLNTYVSILEDVNTTEEQRKEITEELIDKVPSLTKADFEYGKNLDIVKEKIGAYVLAQASRIEADTLVEENSEKLAKKARLTQINSIEDQKTRIEAFKKFAERNEIAIKIGAGRVSRTKTDEQLQNDLNRILGDLEKDLKPVQDRIQELYGAAFSGGLGENKGADKLKTSFDELKEQQSELKKRLEESILTKGKDADETKTLAADYVLLSNKIKLVNDQIKGLGGGDDTEKLADKISKLKPILADLGLDIDLKGKTIEDLKGLEKALEKYKSTIININSEVYDDILATQQKIFSDAADVAKATGNKIKESLEVDPDAIEVEIVFKTIDDIDVLAKQIEKKLSRIGFDGVDLSGFKNVEALDAFDERLTQSLQTANIFTDAIGSSFSALGAELSQSLQTGIGAVDAFVGSIISSLANLLAELVAQAITQAIVGNALASVSGVVAQAQGVQIATSFAAALGPAGFIALPGLLAATQLEISGALALAKIPKFAEGGVVGGNSFYGDKILARVNSRELILDTKKQKILYEYIKNPPINVIVEDSIKRLKEIITNTTFNDNRVYEKTINIIENTNFTDIPKFPNIPKFATGGIVGGGQFTGDKIPIFINSGERILTVQDQSFLTNILRNGTTATTNRSQPESIVGEVILRGTNQVIQLRRSERKMSRFYSS